jgi:hypothetical protein
MAEDTKLALTERTQPSYVLQFWSDTALKKNFKFHALACVKILHLTEDEKLIEMR